jgi:hypothetical protein
MKNLKNYLSISLVLLTLLFYSNLVAQERVSPQQFDYVGIEHNEGLDEFLNILNANKSKTILTSNKKVDLLKNYLSSELSEARLDSESASVINSLHEKATSFTYLNDKNLFDNLEMSRNLRNYLKNLNSLIDNSRDLKSLKASIDSFCLEARSSELTNEELSILYGAASTAKFSADYWSNNMDKWEVHFDKTNTTQAKGFWSGVWDGIKHVAGADAEGAVAGAVGAAAANLIIGPGTVAYGAAIVTTGVANSVLSVF